MVRTNYFGNDKIYCRTIEERILTDWENGKKHAHQLTKRDNVTVSLDGTKNYRLWNTDLVRCSNTGDVFINVTGNSDMDLNYYRYGRMREVIMTQTTKNRLNMFLNYYGFTSLEVHSSIKDWSVKYNGEELKIDSWYKLDFDNKKLLFTTDSNRL